MDDVRAKIYGMLIDDFGLVEEDIKGESTFDALGLDSIDAGEITTIIEEKFSITIDEHDFQKVRTVDELVSYVKSRIPK